jgi:hypothetical protein
MKFPKQGVLIRKVFMLKNLFLLGLLTWVSMTYAKTPVTHETMADAESFKVEKPVEQHEAKRSLAGSKIKKGDKKMEKTPAPESSESDSEVRYWQYSE